MSDAYSTVEIELSTECTPSFHRLRQRPDDVERSGREEISHLSKGCCDMASLLPRIRSLYRIGVSGTNNSDKTSYVTVCR